jgi:hypothetical protein
MPYITDAQLKQAVKDRLGLAADQPLASRWDSIIADANQAGWQDIVNHLRARGYTQAQVDAWDSRAVFNRDQGLFWALTNGAGLHGFDDRYIGKLDRRAELDGLVILIVGVATAPGDTAGEGQVKSGALKTDADLFFFGRNQDRRPSGRVIRW